MCFLEENTAGPNSARRDPLAALRRSKVGHFVTNSFCRDVTVLDCVSDR